MRVGVIILKNMGNKCKCDLIYRNKQGKFEDIRNIPIYSKNFECEEHTAREG